MAQLWVLGPGPGSAIWIDKGTSPNVSRVALTKVRTDSMCNCRLSHAFARLLPRPTMLACVHQVAGRVVGQHQLDGLDG